MRRTLWEWKNVVLRAMQAGPIKSGQNSGAHEVQQGRMFQTSHSGLTWVSLFQKAKDLLTHCAPPAQLLNTVKSQKLSSSFSLLLVLLFSKKESQQHARMEKAMPAATTRMLVWFSAIISSMLPVLHVVAALPCIALCSCSLVKSLCWCFLACACLLLTSLLPVLLNLLAFAPKSLLPVLLLLVFFAAKIAGNLAFEQSFLGTKDQSCSWQGVSSHLAAIASAWKNDFHQGSTGCCNLQSTAVKQLKLLTLTMLHSDHISRLPWTPKINFAHV